MQSVATFVSAAAARALDEETLRRAARILPGSGTIHWLEERVAADLFFEAQVTPALEAGLQRVLADQPIDFFVQPVEGRRKKLLMADMDSTVIAQECLDELADFVGFKAHVAAITAQAMRGEIAFEPALRERVALLEDLPVHVIDTIAAERITLTPGAETLVRTMRANSAFTVLVSSGFSAFTRKVAARAGFDADAANELEIADGKLTGRVEEPILGRIAKRQILDNFCERLRIDRQATLAVGDGANDLDMLGAAGLSVAYRAKPAVAAAAHARVDHADLTALLYAQGYRRADFSLSSSDGLT